MMRRPLGRILKDRGIISEEELKEGLKKKEGIPIGEKLLRIGAIREEELLGALSLQLGIPYIRISDDGVDSTLITKIPPSILHHYKVFPIKEDDERIVLATSNPLRPPDNLRSILGKDVEYVISSEADILSAIKRYYGLGADTMERMMKSEDELEVVRQKDDMVEMDEMAKDASIIRFVNQVIIEAFDRRASDIHIEPYEDDLRIRYRIDGILHEISTPKSIKIFQPAIISRIKIMASLDIAEKRLPQDGRIRLRIRGEEIDIRVSILPTPFGESVDMRLLTRANILFGLEELGMSQSTLKQFNELITSSHGIILVSGPTGSGKTTTLYAAINRLNTIRDKIVTIEDPIEYRLKGIDQIQVKPKIGLSFANGLRYILRHDPDIILVGEIRDLDTARISIQASLTGHLVFSTLHTNDAPEAITRLIDMGIEPYLVASSIGGVLAQRLVRRVCLRCKKSYSPRHEILERLGLRESRIKFYHGVGCEECLGTGYYGRIGIFELLVNDDVIRELIYKRTPTNIIRQRARGLGMKSLCEDGLEKVKEGITTPEEIYRVIQEG
jgi:type II secretion system protein E